MFILGHWQEYISQQQKKKKNVEINKYKSEKKAFNENIIFCFAKQHKNSELRQHEVCQQHEKKLTKQNERKIKQEIK